MDKKDFFISYTGSDEKYATWVAEILEKNNYSVIIQAWDFRPGDNFVSKINESLENCKKLMLILSNRYFTSKWCEAEWTSKLAEGIRLQSSAVIPVRVEAISVDGLLGPIVYIDLVDKTEEEAAAAILNGVRETVERRNNSSPYPLYNIKHLQIDNDYYVNKDYIVSQKTCRSRVLRSGFRRLHNRIDWSADETIKVRSLTDGVTIEYLDLKDTSLNYNVVFDHVLEKGEEIEFCVQAVATNVSRQFKNFFSTEIISPVERLNIHLRLEDETVKKYYTQKVANSPMNVRSEAAQMHELHQIAHWYIEKPELHFEYKIFW